jgi:hypothetical protein
MRDLPPRLHLKHGSYYYVVLRKGKRLWTKVANDKDAAIQRALELNSMERRDRIDRLGMIRSVNDTIRRSVMDRDGHKCVYCGTTQDLVMDHFIPHTSGGATALGNLVTACVCCNDKKGDRDPRIFLAEISGMRDYFLDKFIGSVDTSS